jgi:hypothetical protein
MSLELYGNSFLIAYYRISIGGMGKCYSITAISFLPVYLETLKRLQKNTVKTLQDIDICNDFLNSSGNNNKWDYTKLKSFCTTKERITRVKRQPMEWEKNFY